MARETLGVVLDGLLDSWGGPGQFGGPSRRSGRVSKWRDGSSNPRRTLRRVGGPRGGSVRVGGPMGKPEKGRGTFGEV